MDCAAASEMKPNIPTQRLMPFYVPSPEEQAQASFIDLSRSSSPIDTNDGGLKMAKVDPKLCGVCGDKALGNNFNAITCESCKAFFRRNALKQKEFVCPFSDNCKVDPITRRFCQKCRLKKCFDIGMKKEWIMTDEEKKLKKRKIEQNRVKRQSSDVPSDPPPAKTPCLTGQNGQGEELRSVSHQAQRSPPDPTLPQHVAKQPMLPHTDSGADSTTYDHVAGEDEIPVVQSSNIDYSPSSSNSSSDVNVAYTAPAAGQMTPLHVSQIEAPQLLNKSSSTSHNGQLSPNHPMELESNNSMKSMLNQRPPPDFQPYWQDESPNHLVRHYSIPSGMMYANQGDREPMRAPDLSPPIVVMGQGNKVMHYPTQSSNQVKPGNPSSQMLSSNQYYQMPLLSSLIRPGEPESPPESNGMGMGNIIQRSNMYMPYGHGHEQLQSCLPMEHPMGPSGLRPPPPHTYTCHSGNPYRSAEMEDDIPPPLPLNTTDSIVSVAIRAEFNSFGMFNQAQESNSNQLNGAEIAKLQELMMACEALGDPVDQEGPVKLSKNSDPTLINVINLTDIAIRRLIKMSKKISGFKNMCQEDQIALLKGGCTEMMILRSVVTYDPDRDSWNIPHSYGYNYNIKLGVLKEARGNLYEEHQRFVKSFKPEWRSDENIMILLCAITLFTAERPNVIHKDVVKLEQDSYYYLLKRYLESILNGCEARSTYLLLIRKIAELRILNSTHLRVFLEVNPREVEPLLREVFSMV